jgi:hypothetical protein
MPPGETFRCNICGITVPIEGEHQVRSSVYNTCNFNVDLYKPRLNVCSKCLPKLMTMFKRAIIKTSKLMVAENGGVSE